MYINLRKKPRQTGKTSDIMEMTELLMSMGRNVVLLFHNRSVLEQIKKNFSEFVRNGNKEYSGTLLVGETSNLNFLRGHRFDTLLVDEWSLTKNQNEIISICDSFKTVLYVTDDSSYYKEIFSNKPI